MSAWALDTLACGLYDGAMIEIVKSQTFHEVTLRTLLAAVEASGGNLDTGLLIEADGEPVYIQAELDDAPAEGLDNQPHDS